MRVSKKTSSSPATIRDIARTLNVSVTSVSRALRGLPKVSEELRKEIAKVAEDLGYVPNAAAAALSSGRTQSILFVVPETNRRFPTLMQMEVLEGLIDVSSDLGFTVTVASERFLQRRTGSYLDALPSMNFDGAVLLRVRANDPFPKVFSFPYPTVVINKALDAQNADFVITDDEAAAYDATKYLIDNGHTAIAHVAGLSDNLNALLRRKGYERALRDHGIAPSRHLVVTAKYARAAGADAANQLLAKKNPFSAVFCGTDLIAFGLISGLRDAGVRVPDDISVVSFDDDALAEFNDPPLTSVNKPRYEMGETAGRLLINRIRGTAEAGPVTIRIPTKLIIRRSSCPKRT